MEGSTDNGAGIVDARPLRIEALGPIRALTESTELQLGGTKPKLLVALLVVAGPGGVSDARLIEAIWPEDADSSELADRTSSLRAYVSRLRSELRPTGADLVRIADGYALDLAGGTTDLADFERLANDADELLATDPRRAAEAAASALALWRGRAFAGFDDTVMLVAPTARLDERRAQCVEDRIDALLGLADTDTALVEASAHVIEHPYRERPAAQLALGLYRSGRQREALAELSNATRRLRDDLGLDPSREITDLQTAILEHDPRLETPRTPPVVATADTSPAPKRRADAPHHDLVVGRQRELEQLATTTAERRSALLVGLAGSGKSTLVRHVPDAVIGRCHQHPDAPPTWPWGDVIRQLAVRCPDTAEVSRAAALLAGTDTTTVFDTALAVAQAVQAVAPTVGVIVIEDLHWASAPARQLTSFVLREVIALGPEERVSIIGTTRPAAPFTDATPDGAASEALDVSSAGLSLASFETTITVGPLSRGAIATILANRLTRPPATPVVDTVLRESGGLALLVRRAAEELVAGRSVRLPERDELVSSWLASADEVDLEVARHGAIVGEEFTDTLLTIACGDDTPADSIAASLDRLRTVGLVERDVENDVDRDSERWRFGHALLINALVDSIAPAARRAANLRLAHHLLAASNAAQHSDAIVHHLDEAAEDADPNIVLEVATDAARAARQSGAHDAAARHLRVATSAASRLDLASDERFDLLVLAGEVTWAAGDAGASRTYFAQAAELLDIDDSRVAEVAAGYAGFGMTHVEVDAPGRLLLERAVALPPATGVDAGTQLRCRSRLIIADWDPVTIRDDAAAAIAHARVLGDRQALAWSLGAQLVSSMTMPLIDQRLIAAEEMLDLGRELGDDSAIGLGLAHRADARAGLGFIDEAHADIKRLGQLASATGQPAHQWYSQHYLGALRCSQGRLDEGEALLNAAFGTGQLSQGAAALEAYSGALFMARAAAGREVELLPLLEGGDNPAGDDRPTGLDPWLLGRAIVLAAAGRHDEARPVLAQMTAIAQRVQVDRVSSIEIAQMLLAAHALGDAEAAEVAYALLEPYAHHCCAAASMILVGSAQAFLGLGALTMGRHDEAVERIRLGVANNDRWGLHAWSGQGRAWLADAESAAGVTPTSTGETHQA